MTTSDNTTKARSARIEGLISVLEDFLEECGEQQKNLAEGIPYTTSFLNFLNHPNITSLALLGALRYKLAKYCKYEVKSSLYEIEVAEAEAAALRLEEEKKRNEEKLLKKALKKEKHNTRLQRWKASQQKNLSK